MSKPIPLWQMSLAKSAANCDALEFAVGVLGFKMPGEEGEFVLDPWQVEALRRVSKQWRTRNKRNPRLSIRSGHGVGKTCFLSIVILWVLFISGPDCKIPVVASGQDQLRDGLWPELSKWISQLPATLRAEIEWQKERVVMKAAPESAFAVRRTASEHRPEALQGIHAKTILVILEEASGISESTIEAGAGTLSTPGAGIIAVGNPTRGSGFFFKTHNSPQMRSIWETMVVSCEDVPRAQNHIADIVATYGKNSNAYRVRCLGQFPLADDQTVISLEDVIAAKGRNVTRSWVYPKWGLDVARFGDDASVLVKRQGNTLIDVPRAWRNMDGSQIAGRVIDEYKRTPNDMKPKMIAVDVIGVGTSAYDHLKSAGSPCRTITVGVNVAESPAVSDRDRKLRDELWFKGREWFAAKDCCIPLDLAKTGEDAALIERLIGELTTVTYDFDDNGRRVVERKKDMKARLGHSPDLADGFLLTFYGGSFPRDTDSYGRPKHDDDYDVDDLSDAWAA